MQRAFQISTLALVLVLGGCSGEEEETPDITEAIPLDTADNAGSDQDGSSNDPGVSGEETAAGSGNNGGGVDGGGVNGGGATQDRSAPATMESGRNPPSMTEPPAGSKVQRIK